MLAAFAEINWIAVLAGTVAFAVLAGLYFGAIAPKAYRYATGRENSTKEELAQAPSGPLFVVVPLLCSLLIVITDAYLIRDLGIDGVGGAVALALIVGVGYLVAMTFNIAINPLFPRPLVYGLLNTPYFLVANVIASILLVVIRW